MLGLGIMTRLQARVRKSGDSTLEGGGRFCSSSDHPDQSCGTPSLLVQWIPGKAARGVRLTAHIHLTSTLRLLHVCTPLQMIVSVAMSPCPVVRCPDSILLPRHVTLRGGLRWDSHQGSTNTWNFGTLVRMVSAVLWWAVIGELAWMSL